MTMLHSNYEHSAFQNDFPNKRTMSGKRSTGETRWKRHKRKKYQYVNSTGGYRALRAHSTACKSLALKTIPTSLRLFPMTCVVTVVSWQYWLSTAIKLQHVLYCTALVQQRLLTSHIRHYTMDDLHWKTDRQAASLIQHIKTILKN